jgi:hypothetical protein
MTRSTYTSAPSGAIPATVKTPSSQFFLVRDECLIDLRDPQWPISLVVPEFTDDRVYGAEVELARYERLAHATGKAIDLFFDTRNDDHNAAGRYEPGGVWKFSMPFCGRDFFLCLTLMSFEQRVDAQTDTLRLPPLSKGETP